MFYLKMKPLTGAALAMFSLVVSSCIDDRYDLDKDIDMTINAGGEHLAVPVGSTDTAFLSKIIELEDDDLLGVDEATREYRLSKTDDINIAPQEVSTVTVSASNVSLDGVDIVDGNAAVAGGLFVASVETEGDLETSAADVDEALKELGSLKAGTPAELTIHFGFDAQGISYNKVQSKSLKLIFPEILMFASDPNLNGNVLTFPEGYDLSLPYTLKVDGYYFGNKAGEGKKPVNGTLAVTEKVKTVGEVLTTGIAGNGTLTLLPEATLSELTGNEVTGVIQPVIDAEDTDITLDGLPDFLKDDDTRLDMTNPVFSFVATNNMETPITVDVVMIPEREGADLSEKKVTVNGLVLDPKATTTIALSRTGESGIQNAKDKEVDNINDLIEVIPDLIKVELEPRIDNKDYYTADLGVSYEMPSSYDVNIPLQFEQGLTIIYNDSIDDLNKDLVDLDVVDFDVANLIFTAVNTIPLELEMKPENVIVKDIYGKKIETILVESDGRKITESKDGTEKAESEFTLKLTSKEPGVLSRVERICFKVTAVPGQATGVPLKDTQWLKMPKIKLNVPGGVKVDLN